MTPKRPALIFALFATWLGGCGADGRDAPADEVALAESELQTDIHFWVGILNGFQWPSRITVARRAESLAVPSCQSGSFPVADDNYVRVGIWGPPGVEPSVTDAPLEVFARFPTALPFAVSFNGERVKVGGTCDVTFEIEYTGKYCSRTLSKSVRARVANVVCGATGKGP